jgi:serine/alanine adding enzyme
MMGAPRAAVSRASGLRVHAEPSLAAWDRYVSAHPEASGYHRAAWTAVIASAFGHRVRRIVAESTRGIEGVLPLVLFRSRLFGRFGVSLPFLNYGGIVADSPEAERLLLDEAIHECQQAGARYLELRHTKQRFSDLPSKRHKVAMTLKLEADAERQWLALDRKVRNLVRKAEKSGMRLSIGGAELVPAFYEVFARNMRDLGTPVYAARFFHHVMEALPDHSRAFCIFADQQPVASSIVCWHRDTVEVPWASSLRQFNQYSPNMLLYWSMLRFAIERGLRTFDFGRSTREEGTYHFKRQWGAEPRDLVWEYWTAPGTRVPDLSPKNPKFGRAIRVWQHLPVRITTLIGPSIVRNIP